MTQPTIHVSGPVRYLTEPGALLIAQTMFDPSALRPFLKGMGNDEVTSPTQYGQDMVDTLEEGLISEGGALTMFAGQICYLALGEKRTKPQDADKYFDNIMKQSHGSILEHSSYTFLLYGVDRAVTHELVRHRLAAYSQVSQRYVGVDALRFCMPYEAQGSPELEGMALIDFEYDFHRYSRWIKAYMEKYPQREGESKTEHRKRIQSTARRCLPNWVEAPIVVTANLRAWRHMLTMRCSRHADVAIRRACYPVYQAVRIACPEAFLDWTTEVLPDGSTEARPTYVKV